MIARLRRPGKIAFCKSHCRPGDAELQLALVRDARNHFGKRQADGQRRQQKYEAGQRPRDADIEQHALGIDRRADADEGAERSHQRRRQEVRQAGIHAVVQGREVVAELVRQQDGQQRQRKRQARRAASRDGARTASTARGCAPDRRADCGRNRTAWPRPPGGGEQREQRTAARAANSARAGGTKRAGRGSHDAIRVQRVGRRRNILG